MRVDRGFDFVQVASSVMARPSSAISLGGFGADDVRAEDFAVRFAEEELHEAFGLADGEGLAAGLKGNLPTLNLRPFSFAARSVRPMLATCGWQ